MSRAKLLVVTCFAAFTLSAVVSATALAGGQWDINGTPLAAKATVGLGSFLILSEGKLKILAAGETPEIVCKAHSVDLEKGVLIGPDAAFAKSIIFHECVVQNSINCELANSSIQTVPLHALAHLDGTLNALILILPATKTVLETIKFEGATCALEGIQAVTGGLHMLLHEATHSFAVHRGLVFSLKGQLKVGVSEADIEGLVGDIALTSGVPWSFL